MSDPGAGDGDDADGGGASDEGRPPSERSPDDSGGADGHPDERAASEPNGGAPDTGGASDEAGTGGAASADVPRSTVRGADDPAADSSPETAVEWVKWFFRTDSGAVVYLREVISSVGLVLLVGLLLFAVSGLWPPMVAVESGSMEPHMQRGDLVFVMEEHRFAPPATYKHTGVVTYRIGKRVGYRKFQLPGDVIVYQPNGRTRVTPIIHRARFWVNESENWVANGKANPAYLGAAESCGQLSQCPAPHAGFITKGDANSRYDQVSGLSEPVKPSWVVGTAEFRIPMLGYIRLWAAQTSDPIGGVGGVGGTVPVASYNESAAPAAGNNESAAGIRAR